MKELIFSSETKYKQLNVVFVNDINASHPNQLKKKKLLTPEINMRVFLFYFLQLFVFFITEKK